MKLKFIICIFYLMLTSVGYSDSQVSNPSNKLNYLKKPTGQYGVGFDDFHWVNQNICPDFNFNGKNQQDFSPGNTKHCHEVVARIYYPTASHHQPGSLYYRPLIKSAQQNILQQVPTIQKRRLEQLTKIRTFSREKAPLVGDKKFPVLVFSPGFACPVQLYENSITELVSQGYIVVGINTPFINLVELPNGHVVKPADFQNKINSDAILRDKFVPLQSQDLIYVHDKLHELHHTRRLFSSMDLKHVGVFGHSIGAWTVAVVAHDHPTWFQAVAPLDIGPDKTGQPLKKLKNFTIPVMYQINSIRKLVSPYLPVTYELAHNGYLVEISPNERDDTYSHHMNFTDWSTLQYLPAYAAFFEHLKIEQIARGFNLKVMFHPPTTKDIATFDKITYVLSKQKDTWHLSEYFVDPQHKQLPVPVSFFDVHRVDGLPEALSALPNHPMEKLTDADIEPIKKIVTSLNNAMAPVLGVGNGWKLTDSINTYLVQFFNTYLKGNVNPAFKACIPLHKDTFITCGPAQA